MHIREWLSVPLVALSESQRNRCSAHFFDDLLKSSAVDGSDPSTESYRLAAMFPWGGRNMTCKAYHPFSGVGSPPLSLNLSSLKAAPRSIPSSHRFRSTQIVWSSCNLNPHFSYSLLPAGLASSIDHKPNSSAYLVASFINKAPAPLL